MRVFCYFLLFIILCVGKLKAADTVYVRETQIPILIERQDNVLFYLRLDARESRKLTEVSLNISSQNLSEIESVKLYYGGTEALQDRAKNRFAPVSYVSGFNVGQTLAANPSYSILCAEVKRPAGRITLQCDYNLFDGINFFWISLQMKPGASLQTKIQADLSCVKLDGRNAPVKIVSASDIVHRVGVGVRHAGDDGAAAYRIPGLVTTNEGTLLAVYDIRYNNSVDLQEHIDIGLSRSVDGGRTWEKMRVPLAFKNVGGLPAAQNGAGDPCILFDTKTHTAWIAALWTHGCGNQRAWWSSHQGMTPEETGQLVLTRSNDDGKTWSEPINVTAQVKDPSWYLLLQGPGRGITMDDGTLVFPIQFIDSTRVPNAGVMYSKNQGSTWEIHNLARTNTTEAQVVEVEPGVLMLNMRDNRGGSRAVATTS